VAIFDVLRKSSASRRWGSLVAAGLLSFTLYGCGSSDNAVVVPPPVVVPPTATNTAAVIAAEAAKAANDSATNQTAPFTVMSTAGLVPVTINSKPVVNFSIFSDGAVKTGLTTSNVRFALSKLVPGANGSPAQWVNYYWGNDTLAAGMDGAVQKADGSWTEGTSVIKVADQAKARSSSTDPRVATQLVYNADGYYTYTFDTDVADLARASAKDSSGTAVTYEPLRTHRLSMQLSYTNAAGDTVLANPIYEFTIGADGKSITVTNPALTKNVVDIRSCNNCHEKIAFHGGGRIDTKYCVQCHQPGSIDGGTGESIDLMLMVHKLHAGKELSKRYVVYRTNSVYDYSFVGFPQPIANCVKCHDGSAAATGGLRAYQTAQGDNWMNVPNRAACGSCHDAVNFTTGAGHTGLNIAQADDSKCALCHTAADIKLYHVTDDATPNNLTVPVGAANITYEISSATVNSATATTNPNATVIKFRIKSNGAPLNVATQPAAFTGGPSFLMAWSMSQDLVTTPADYNNIVSTTSLAYASTTGDGPTISLADLRTAANGSISAPDADGWQTATVLAASGKTFPVGAKMRAVALQGYFTQVTPAVARHAVSVVKSVTNDAVRRSIVDNAKCANCHDWLALHGGNRVYEVQVCVMCHNTSKATSGRGAEDARVNSLTGTSLQLMNYWKMDLTLTNKALQFPVVSNNMKDMIHGMHVQKDRAIPFRDARHNGTRAGMALLDFSRIAFPGVLKNCETCHKPGTYASVPAAALASTQESRSDVFAGAPASVTPTIAYASLLQANNGDVVTTPFTAACVSCHDSALAKSHVVLNGGIVGAEVLAKVAATDTRDLMMSKGGPGAETCALCHGAGKIADVTVVHK